MTAAPETSPLFRELRRKSLHLIALVIPFGLLLFPGSVALPLLFSAAAAFLAVEILRLRFSRMNAFFFRWFSPLLRENEERKLTGATGLMISSSLCTLVFLSLEGGPALPREARAALFYAFTFLILGDAAAALLGKRYGKRRLFGEKTVVGTLACLLTCLLVYALFNGPLRIGMKPAAAILAACLTALLEALPLKFDDNLFVPPVTCFTLFFLQRTNAFV
jgi:dolichol kinase